MTFVSSTSRRQPLVLHNLYTTQPTGNNATTATYYTGSGGSLTINVLSGHSGPLRVITNGASVSVWSSASEAEESHNIIRTYEDLALRSSPELRTPKKT